MKLIELMSALMLGAVAAVGLALVLNEVGGKPAIVGLYVALLVIGVWTLGAVLLDLGRRTWRWWRFERSAWPRDDSQSRGVLYNEGALLRAGVMRYQSTAVTTGGSAPCERCGAGTIRLYMWVNDAIGEDVQVCDTCHAEFRRLWQGRRP